MKEFVIDLFCGAGGTSTGIHLSNTGSVVTACVNHDPVAIESHRNEHPYAKHFVEDIRNPEILLLLKLRVDSLRKKYPGCIITIWASLECTNFSNAKGGLPRDADSRTLANHLFMYIDYLNPDYLMIENVMEFMSWGPLDENGKPISRNKGEDYERWVEEIKSRGFAFDWRKLKAADYGGYTIRQRYFAQFAKDGLPISWPESTHSEKPSKDKAPWKPVKDILDFCNKGKSMFSRKIPLVENTLKRIYAGLLKFVAKGDEGFLTQVTFNTGNIEDVAVRGSEAEKVFMQTYYGNGNVHTINDPSPTLSTKDRIGKVSYLMLNYSSGDNVRTVEGPVGTVVNNDKHNLITSYIFNPQFGNSGNSVEVPAPTVIARQDKKPLGLVSCVSGNSYVIPVFDTDSPTMIKIKKLMVYYGIGDILTRMLTVEELLQIQGFPKDYKLVGTQGLKKKFIGNSVEVNTAKALFEAHYKALKAHTYYFPVAA